MKYFERKAEKTQTLNVSCVFSNRFPLAQALGINLPGKLV